MTTTPDTIPDRAELPPLPEPIEINWPTMHASGLGCGVEDRGLRGRYECAEYGWQEGVDAAADSVPEEIYTAEQMREYALAARSLAGTPQAEPLKAAPDAVSERLHEFRVRLSEYGVAMYHEQSQKAKVLADVLSSMLEAALSTTQQAAKSAASSDDEQREEIEAVIACLGDDAASLREDNSEDERAANMERAAELLESLSVPMPAGAAVGEPAYNRRDEWTHEYRRLNPESMWFGCDAQEAERFNFQPERYEARKRAATTPTTGGASTPTGGQQP